MTKKEKIAIILDKMSLLFPEPKSELNFSSNFELLVAVVLSAQCKDSRVNIVSKELFGKYPTAKELSNANPLEVERIIHSLGFFRAKAKNIVALSRDIEEKFLGVVPDTREELESLSGVGRKTAGVVLAVGFSKNEIPVDTHVFRVSKRLGLTKALTPEKCELDLREIFHEKDFSRVHHYFILFGRRVCSARKPDCVKCPLSSVCEFFKKR